MNLCFRILVVFFLLDGLGIGFLSSQQRGDLLSSEWIGNRNFNQIEAIYNQFNIPTFFSPIKYEIDLYKIVYRTPAATGDSLTIASGLLMVPIGTCDFPFFCYNHGTSLYGSPISSLGGEWPLGIFFAANGYLTIMPDYLGMGETPITHPHPYIHAKSEATTVVDMLRATQSFCEDSSIRTNSQIFLSGYSQGGHVAMSAFRELETLHAGEMTVTAAAPASGPYDVSRTTRDTLLLPKPSATGSFYLSYVLMSYQYVYGNMWSDPSDIFVPPYDVQIPAFFDRENPQPGMVFPDTARNMFWPELIDSLQADTAFTHPINQALQDNDVYNWTPTAPVKMLYCEADEQVPYTNSIIAQDQFIANGASNSSLLSAGATFSHGDCAAPALLGIKSWFDTMRADCTEDTTTTGISRDLSQIIKTYPNPFRDHLIFHQLDPGLRIDKVNIFDLQGRLLAQLKVDPLLQKQKIVLPELPAGMYVFRWLGEKWRGSQMLKTY